MRSLLTIACLCLGAELVLSADVASAAVRDEPTVLDALPSEAPAVNIGERAPRVVAPERQPVGNPLWAIPLSSLRATRERPIFAPSRRPPAPVVAGPPPANPGPPPPAPAERPNLTLIGAVVGETEAIAIFLDPAMEAIRLHPGEGYAGWVLNSVKGREAILQKDDERWVFVLPAASATSGLPNAASPAATDAAGSVPFVPRHTPKNGEPDGL
jgi:general secretion pathway protein N